jgi:hypothetical protein
VQQRSTREDFLGRGNSGCGGLKRGITDEARS